MLSGIKAGCVIAGKEYESSKIPAFILANGATAVIPPKSNRGDPCEYDRERNLIERAFNKLKRWRRIAIRYALRSQAVGETGHHWGQDRRSET